MKLKIFQAQTTYSSAKFMLSKIDNHDFDIEHIVVVPDKFSLLTEKMLLDIFPQGSLFNVKVKTLSSLSRELLQKLGRKSEIISSGETLFLTATAIENVKKEFVYFKKSSINFCHEISKIISQLKSSVLTPEEIAQEGGDFSQGKYHDIALIYKEYQRLLAGDLDANERMTLLQNDIEKADILANTKLYFAHYDAFTAQAFEFITTLFQKTLELSVSIPACENIGNDYIYEKDLQSKFVKVASLLGQRAEVFIADECLNQKQKAIASGLYSYQKVSCCNEGFYNLFASPSVAVEVESVAKLIRFCVYKGMRYKDFQIAVGWLGKYQSQIENIFDRYQIPYYIDSSIGGDKTILASFVLSFFNAYVTGFAKDNLIDLFANILIRDENLIEICQNNNIEGRERYKRFAQQHFVLAQEMEKLGKSKTSREFGEIVTSLCEKSEEEYNIVLEKLQEEDLKQYKINIQAREIIDESVKLINKYSSGEVSCSEYFKMLKLLLSFRTVSTVPTYVDGVMIGDATQSGFEEKAALIVMGGEELPLAVGDTGILSDEELQMKGCDKIVEPTIRMINRRNRFKLFNLLTLAQRRLFVFYQFLNEEGKKNELPAYIKSLNGIFGQSEMNARSVFFSTEPTSPDQALLVSGIRKANNDFSYLSREEKIENADKLLFGGGKARVTQIENFFVCPFKHYATYGLKLKEQLSEFDARDLGSVCHKMAEIFVKRGMFKKAIGSKEIKRFIDENLLSVLEEEGVKEKIDRLEEGASLIGFLKKQCNSLLSDIVKENSHSKFVPRYNEMKFDNLTLCGKYTLIGKADRIDQYGDYLRIIDYKTGRTGNLLKQLYYGEKLQLFLYQKIACEKFEKKEGGIFYFNAKFNYTKNDEESAYILKGLVDDEEEVINATDSDIAEIGKSSITQIKIGKNGYTGLAIAPVRLNKLGEYALQVAEKAAQEIEEGYIQPKPVQDACQWCPYAAVCGYEISRGVRANKDDVEF